MCLIAFDWQPNKPDWLILTANRDEFYQRPTAALARWSDSPTVVAGRDLEQGGTWMGITDALRFAAVTNIRRPDAPKDKRSRGDLVGGFLNETRKPADAARELLTRADEYGWFNLLLGTPESLWYVRNWPEPFISEVAPGVHVLSNEHLDSPWPKSKLALNQLQQWQQSPAPESLAGLLAHRQSFSDDELPITGMPVELERQLSPQFLNLRERHYGTRSTTSLIGVVGDDGHPLLKIRELGWDDMGKPMGEVAFEIPRVSHDHPGL